ncbi:MAG: hypothetical protein H6713_16115 [Myxococcales bacterium]|nr:hypothetical protein [Myxococcales bacterium]
MQTITADAWRIEHTRREAVAIHRETGARVEIYSEAHEARECVPEPGVDPSLADSYEYMLTGDILSVVDGVVSYRVVVGGYCGGAHPFAWDSFRTLRLSTGAPARLHELFPRAEIDAALAADSFVQGVREGDSGDCSRSYFLPDSDRLENFAFHHRAGDRVAVRLGLSHNIEVCRGQLAEVGLLLRPSAELARALETAQRGGLLMGQLYRTR